MRKLRIIFLCCLLVTCPLNAAQQINLSTVNYLEGDERQLNLEFVLSDRAIVRAFVLANPDRLVVDFKNTAYIRGKLLAVNAPLYIDKVRTGRRENGGLRVVYDFKQGYKPIGKVTKKNSSNKSYILLNVHSDFVRDDAISSVVVPKALPKPKQLQQVSSTPSFVPKTKKPTKPSKLSKKLFSDWEVSGKVSFEELGFFNQGLGSKQHLNYISGAIEPEIYREWDGGRQSFTFSPFFRYSQHDSRRTHFDIRELTWLFSEKDWELRVGFRKVFWGVAEGLHLVDIINQTDLIENTDTEDKFGQPMVNLALIRDWGTVDLFILPGFRERSFPGEEGRFRSFPEVSVGNAKFERHGFEKHMAYAVRWAQVIGDWDIGLSHFYGTSREPVLKPEISQAGSMSLVPYYELINQTGLDIQLTLDDWIVKHEGIIRSGQGKTFYAMSTGVEYTLFNLFSTGLDLGFVAEYMYDTRGGQNTSAPFQDDILAALRFGFNDVQSTEILAGVMFDRTNNSKFYNVEASRRFGDSFKVDLELRVFSGAPKIDSSYSLRHDDHVRLEVSYYY